MSKVVINSYEEFERLLGQQIGVSDWLEVTQERINQFADATLDHQWIHVDLESDYRSEQPEDDGKLWDGQDAFRPGCIVGATHPHDG